MGGELLIVTLCVPAIVVLNMALCIYVSVGYAMHSFMDATWFIKSIHVSFN